MIGKAFARGLAAAVLLAAGTAVAQDSSNYPNKRVTVLVPFGPGGPGEVLLRIVTDGLSKKWGQPVIIENKPGAGGVLAHEFAAKAPADGYTLLQGATSFTLYHLLTKDLRFDPLKELTIAAMYGDTEFVLVTSGQHAVKDMREWIAEAKANPGKLNYGSLGRSFVMLSMEQLAQQLGTKLQEVPFKTQPDMVTGAVRNDIQLAIVPIGQTKPLIDEGRLKPLFIVARSRDTRLPNVPTNAEVGLPNYRPQAWQSIMAPSGVSRAILQKINTDVNAIVAAGDYPAAAAKAGMRPFNPSLDEIKKLTDDTVAGWTSVAKALNIKPE